jgi:hypothetical protein
MKGWGPKEEYLVSGSWAASLFGGREMGVIVVLRLLRGLQFDLGYRSTICSLLTSGCVGQIPFFWIPFGFQF